MRPYAKSLLTTAVLLISVALWAQEAKHAGAPDLLARLSYDNPRSCTAKTFARSVSPSRATETIASPAR